MVSSEGTGNYGQIRERAEGGMDDDPETMRRMNTEEWL